ncbi:MAG TPA: septal ring lytic transglycosylase RlpA family protein [Alphaproteobacteria bacterium]|nr:septal ring lytic transglycosylase RlpA family protein [Alphaproteobacteria bacterium]
MLLRWVFVVMLVSGLTACSTAGKREGEGFAGGPTGGTSGFKVGNPYAVEGNWYYPKEDYAYDETGIASWYGPGFSGKRTANGEVFDPGELTAAHRTLPMPSLVRVTNLENGRSVVVRINDRGPFAAGRIIDVSSRAAELLGFDGQGTAKVRVTILPIESKAIADAAKKRYRAEGVQLAQLNPPEGGDMLPAPQAAPRGQVEAVPLQGPAPPSAAQPIANPPENIIKAAELAPKIPDPKPRGVPGKNVNGIFYPAARVEHVKVLGGKRIFVQAGAFSQKENAMRLQQQLSSIGQATVSEADVNGTHFYRVRLGPISSVEEADQVLARVLNTGNNARITVE